MSITHNFWLFGSLIVTNNLSEELNKVQKMRSV